MSIIGSFSAVCPSGGIQRRRYFSRGSNNLRGFTSSECMGFQLQVPVSFFSRIRPSSKVGPLQVLLDYVVHRKIIIFFFFVYKMCCRGFLPLFDLFCVVGGLQGLPKA